jgi:hypothetical protein
VDEAPYEVDTTTRQRFEGRQGEYQWTSLLFTGERMTVRWTASASSKTDCRVGWLLRPEFGDQISSSIRVKAGKTITGNRRYDTPFYGASLVARSTCGRWALSMQAYDPPVPTGVGSNCDGSYPTVCIPPYPPDLDCGDISYRRFDVRGADPHGFDGDNDGIGCEGG